MTHPAPARPNGRSGEPEALRDDVLLDSARSGDAGALAVLRQRYRGTALAVARTRTGSAEEAEGVAEEALGRIEQVVGQGGGPRSFLGAFVVWMVGREADGGTRPVALPDDPSDPASLIRVFSGLPAQWQAFLWRTEVLGHSARRSAAALRLGSAAAADLHRDVFRGLHGLYGQAAAERAAGPDCTEFSAELAHFVRGTRGQRSRRDIMDHLDGCARCTAEYLSRQDIGTGLRTWTLPVLAGLPLWGTEALELARLMGGADAGSGAAAGVAGVGAAAGPATRAGATAARARADATAGISPWSRRRARVLLGAGALVTAAAVAAVGVPGGEDPIPSADGLVAEEALRSEQDTEGSARADDAAAGAERQDDEPGSGAADQVSRAGQDTERSARVGDAVRGALPGGRPAESAAVVADADGSLTADEAGGASPGTPDAAGADEAARSETGTRRSAGVPGGTGTAPSAGPTTSSTSSGGAPASTPMPTSGREAGASPAASSPAPQAGTASPAPSAPISVPAVVASPAPLKVPLPPAGGAAPPSAPAERPGHALGAGGLDGSPEPEAPGGRQAESGPRHGRQSGDGEGGDRNGAQRHGRDRDRGHEDRGDHHGGTGDRDRGHEPR